MTEATTILQALSGEQLSELLALIKEPDSVELKTTVPDVAHRSTIAALGLDRLHAQIRQVWFFDSGVDLSGEQETKTRKALAYFART
jgi:hypothetical protein